MAIEIRSEKEPKAAGQAGSIIGTAQKAAAEWELQKAILRSQQEFQQELRLRQVQLEAQARAREWELEKMEMVSRIDFQQKEQARQLEMKRNQVMYDTLKQQIDKGIVGPEDSNWPQIQNRLLYYQAKAQGADAPATLYNTPSAVMKPQNLQKEARQFLVNTFGTIEAGSMEIKEGLLQAQEKGYDISPFKDLIAEETTNQYYIGQLLDIKGKKYEVVGFYPDGEPDIVEVK